MMSLSLKRRPDEIPALEKLVTDVMETITTLRVPLRADSSYGDTWYDAK